MYKTVTFSHFVKWDAIIDVRSPAEFAEDHIPGAINCPVLDDEERQQVGTLYKQVSAFEARKLGASLTAHHIARYIKHQFFGHDKHWRPLVYCWRGGQRSGAMATVLSQVGWHVAQLQGGYKAYRQYVREQLACLSSQFNYRVIAGPTGSGKSRVLKVLKERGEQVLDLEALASHRGSVLGAYPGQAQPTQKRFDSLLLVQLQQFDLGKPVFVESESKKIGAVSMPEALYQKMNQGECILIDVPLDIRVSGLLEDYAFYCKHPETLIMQLKGLQRGYSKAQLGHWQDLIAKGRFTELVTLLLSMHYDPLYFRSMQRRYAKLANGQHFFLEHLDEAAINALVEKWQ